MKVLFLDVDGVLNSLSWFAKSPPSSTTEVDAKAVARVQNVLRRTGAQLVLSSSWRHCPDLIEKLKAQGLPIIDRTPSINECRRGVEIRAWLVGHPEVTTYAIIDDDADAGEGHEARFVRTYPKHGMYGKHERQLLEILGE